MYLCTYSMLIHTTITICITYIILHEKWFYFSWSERTLNNHAFYHDEIDNRSQTELIL